MWTVDEDRTIRHMRSNGARWKTIAHTLGRTERAVQARNRILVPLPCYAAPARYAVDVSPIPSYRVTFFTKAPRDDVEYQARIRGLPTSMDVSTLDILVDIALWEFELLPDHQPLRDHLLKLIKTPIHQMMKMVGCKPISGTGQPTRAGVATWQSTGSWR
jgi:hypothetical protein